MLLAWTDFTYCSDEATKLFDESIQAIIDAFNQQRKVTDTKITVSDALLD